MIFEDNRSRHDFGCLMIDIPIKNWNDIINKIDDDDVYLGDSHEHGKETNPHVTIHYGFHLDSTKPEDFNKKLRKLQPLSIELIGISSFNNEKYDVLKFDVDCDELHELNKWCKENFEYTNAFDTYHPHVTIAYLKPGRASKYIKKFKMKPTELHCSHVTYSGATTKHSFEPMKQNKLTESQVVKIISNRVESILREEYGIGSNDKESSESAVFVWL